MEIIKNINASCTTTTNALEILRRPDTKILADTANRENPDKWDRGQFYKDFHDELRGLGFNLSVAPCPYGDYTIAKTEAAYAVERRLAEANAKGLEKSPIQKLDLVQPETVCIDTKSSAGELYSNLKYQYEETMQKLRRAHAAHITLYYLVIDDQIVENPDAWTYTGKTNTWHAWKELSSLIEKVESAYGVKVYFCRRADAAIVLARMLVSDYKLPEEDLTPYEMLSREMEYMRVATRLRFRDDEKELSSLRTLVDALVDHLNISTDTLLSTKTKKELSSSIT